ncbi:hypothetical protein CFOL_v3_19947 [Cephalotus follicularis]|uniref:Adh_short domain-containing protein n=1 Tax=Cephalotus follicularis TaxID=3775 RepID=A0A1Q3C8U2_CEPFO|nr:hypothetical protein CFOL_v3_19947 [Cephalotus follicularis]
MADDPCTSKVNNAAIIGMILNSEAILKAVELAGDWPKDGPNVNWDEIHTQTIELAEQCLEINFYGAKRMIEAFLPLLQLSDSPTIVNVSSSFGLLQIIPSEKIRGELDDVESLTEERMDELLNEFLKDFKDGLLETKGWPTHLSAYTVSKAFLNAYTRILAKKYPNFVINCCCPGFAKTDINSNSGIITVKKAAQTPVMLALLPNGGPSGCFFRNENKSSF